MVMALDRPRETDRPHIVKSPERECLEALAKSIEAITDFRTRVVQIKRGGPEVLHVVNPATGHLSEDIACHACDRDESDALWFFWSWGDDIGPADCPDGSAEAIKRVLTPEV